MAASNEGIWAPPEVPDGVDEKKAKDIMNWIVNLEHQNATDTSPKSDAAMIQTIATKIQREA